MRFLDEAKIFVKSGAGGRGSVSFRREKYIEFGGPDGGDGGRGGDIYASVDRNLNTLIDFRYRQHFKASIGGHGMGRCRSGRGGNDVCIGLPLGTQILSEDKSLLLADMVDVDSRVILARGGAGGRGNIAFKSSVNRAPRQFEDGGVSEEMWLWLRLKLLADVGLVGLPNAGKSTFLSFVSAAKPKIADYPFSTLRPQLGVVSDDSNSFVVADIPGLIEGAHSGHGLGIQFLRHVERCRILLHLVDGLSSDVVRDFGIIRDELSLYEEDLTTKPYVIGLSKCDCLPSSRIEDLVGSLRLASGVRVIGLSCHSGLGMDEVVNVLQERSDE